MKKFFGVRWSCQWFGGKFFTLQILVCVETVRAFSPWVYIFFLMYPCFSPLFPFASPADQSKDHGGSRELLRSSQRHQYIIEYEYYRIEEPTQRQEEYLSHIHSLNSLFLANSSSLSHDVHVTACDNLTRTRGRHQSVACSMVQQWKVFGYLW